MNMKWTFFLIAAALSTTNLLSGQQHEGVLTDGVITQELAGTWLGKNEDVALQLTFVGSDDAVLILNDDRGAIAAELKCVDEPASGTVGLRLDYRVAATGEAYSEIIARIERSKDGQLAASVLSLAVEIEPDFYVVSKLPIRKQQALRE